MLDIKSYICECMYTYIAISKAVMQKEIIIIIIYKLLVAWRSQTRARNARYTWVWLRQTKLLDLYIMHLPEIPDV